MSQEVVSQFSQTAQNALNQYAVGKKNQQAAYTVAAILQSKKEDIAAYAYAKRDAVKQWTGDAKTVALTVYSKAANAKNEVVRAYGSKVKTETVEKTDVEIISSSILTAKTTEQKVDNLVRQLQARHPQETRECIIMRAYAVIWTNAKPLLYSTAISVVLAVGIALVYTMVAAGSWMIFLTILKNLGLKVLPTIILRVLSSAGISLATDISLNAFLGLAERNKHIAKILATEIKPQILVNSLKRIGVDIKNYDITIKSLTRQAISSGIAIGTTDIGSYLVSSGISASTKIVGANYAKARKGLKSAINDLSKIPGQVIDEIMTEMPKKETDALQITKTIESKILVKDKPKVIREIPAAQAPEISAIRQMIVENKAMVFGSTTAIALVSIALATNDVSSITDIVSERLASLGAAVPDISSIADKGFDFIRENATARQTLFGLLSSQLGLQKVIDVFIDKLTPNQIARMKVLDHKIRTSSLQHRPTHIQSFFALLLGEKIYTPRELKGMNEQQLKAAAKIKNIKFDKNIGRQALIDGITRDQASRLNNLTHMVSGLVTSTVKTTLSAATFEYAYQNLPYAMSSLADIMKDLKLAEHAAAGVVSALGEGVTAAIGEAAGHAGEIVGNISPEEALAAARAAAEALRLARRAQAKLFAPPVLEEPGRDPDLANQIAARRDALRRLAAAALETDLAKKLGVIVMAPDGIAHPVPDNDSLLDPRLQKAMENIQFTPLMQYLGVQVAKSSISWVPGLGYVEGTLNTINWSLDTAEKVKDLYKVVNVAVQLTDEKGESMIDIGEGSINVLDRLLKQRVPTLSGAVDDLVTLEKVNLKKVTLETLRDKVVYGWDNSRVAYEIGKKIIIGQKVGDLAEGTITQVGDFAESTIKQVGEMVWSAVFSGSGQ